ncbi:MAG: hypothetical protein DWQ34_21075 [Planctomycetota bacterium]|nr:MAG: hypothetical protein DWQ29_09510 [Planctomycetota bacterium]REJ88881.1 MAG: hypothetical protein DWQ34_21075 [Planctomycetota bacterium]REK21279.1 MAG: hypothetical protein DWQ41_21995 [Planctomycetota bacterium]REK32072.1 MAG: hypothetical protein DWQ45_18085 [Planctomycetota bacterium]
MPGGDGSIRVADAVAGRYDTINVVLQVVFDEFMESSDVPDSMAGVISPASRGEETARIQ